MEPVFGNEPIETSDGQLIDFDFYNNWIATRARGAGYYTVYFPAPRSILKSGKGKLQSRLDFDFSTGQADRANAHRYISIRNVVNPADFEFDV